MENDVDKIQLQLNNLEMKLDRILGWKEDVGKIIEILPEAFRNIDEAIEMNGNNINDSLSKQLFLELFMKSALENRAYELFDPRRKSDENKFFYPTILNEDETIEQIVCNKKSLARFGDGEFELMGGKQRAQFQELDMNLSKRLLEVIKSDVSQLMIGIADNYGMLDKYDFEAAKAIRVYMTNEVRALHQSYLDEKQCYYNAYVTRPYIIYADKMTEAPKKRFDKLKSIWENRNVILIEGAKTRFGAGNDLLQGANSVKRILAPATNSFRRYDELLKEALKVAKEGDLFLVALGPSAGVMVYDLCINGIQAVDVGHADLEYEWFLAGKGERVPIPHKYNNEIFGGEVVSEYHDSIYESQIIANYEG